MVLGYEARLSGEAVVSNDYFACCTAQEWRSAPTGNIQGELLTRSVLCRGSEGPVACCARESHALSPSMAVVGARRGRCNPPQVQMPSIPRAFEARPACCTVSAWRQAASGYSQGTAKTNTEYCFDSESASQCCLRAGRERYGPVRLLGAKEGSCSASPEVSYPARLW
ncbi:hypothetical protein D6825_00710 [Candidatus Woesearchaeota archaeon]|nr:MAG: hypothetical protein D6825_00710 [Candidatus Woesearchaeota archaeon]